MTTIFSFLNIVWVISSFGEDILKLAWFLCRGGKKKGAGVASFLHFYLDGFPETK